MNVYNVKVVVASSPGSGIHIATATLGGAHATAAGPVEHSAVAESLRALAEHLTMAGLV